MAKIQTEMNAILKETPIRKEVWKVRRFGGLDEVEMINGSMRFRVTVRDEGREPFVVQWFNDPVPASDFLERLMEAGVE